MSQVCSWKQPKKLIITVYDKTLSVSKKITLVILSFPTLVSRQARGSAHPRWLPRPPRHQPTDGSASRRLLVSPAFSAAGSVSFTESV